MEESTPPIPTSRSDETRILNPREARQTKIVIVDLGDGTAVRARKCDLATMVFNGNVSTPIMQAAQRFIENRELSPADRIAALQREGDDEHNRDAMLEVLRHHAVSVCVEPVVTMYDDGDPDHLPVELLTVPQLLAIWNQTALTPRVGAAAAATFRLRQRSPSSAVLRPRENVRPAPEPLGQAVDYRGA